MIRDIFLSWIFRAIRSVQKARETFLDLLKGLQVLPVKNGAWYRPEVVVSHGMTLALGIGRTSVIHLQSFPGCF